VVLQLPYRDPATQQLMGLQGAGDAEGAFGWPDYDVVIVGGGINGCGIARDAAERGLRVLLLEKNDFGAGTSAYSSRLIHGGLRYLAHFEFDLVRESLRERELLLRDAPHLVRPLPLAIPIYRGAKNPRWMVGIGLKLYDLFARSRFLPTHRLYNTAQLLALYPGLNPNALQGGPVYYDAQIRFPERLCVENVLAAQATGRATILNHTHVMHFQTQADRITSVNFTDTLTGLSHRVSAQAFINASGPWVDAVVSLSDRKQTPLHSEKKQTPRLIGGTEGAHLVVRRFPNGPETALYVEAESDGRPFFIIPWLNDTYLIGTTDHHYQGDPDAVAATAPEVDYLLRETNRVLPQARLTSADVLYTYAGVRPLPYADGKREGAVTRRHLIHDHGTDAHHPLRNLISIIGGKLTTYRSLAEEAVDYLLTLPALRTMKLNALSPCNTRKAPLPGGQALALETSVADTLNVSTRDVLEAYKQAHVRAAASDITGVSEAVVSHWIDLYGSRYRRLFDYVAPECDRSIFLNAASAEIDWCQPLHPDSLNVAAQVAMAVREESACTISDVLLRRLGCGLEPDVGLQSLPAVAHLMACLLDWSPEQKEAEMVAYRHYVDTRNWAFRDPAKNEESHLALFASES
jgi:glycerol-3-phosphate dehydrogenase